MKLILSAFVRHLNVGAVETRPSLSQVAVQQRALILLKLFAERLNEITAEMCNLPASVKPPSELK
jgi:hypothetical protein